MDSWIPFADRKYVGKMQTRGRYGKMHPKGAVIHYTGGSSTEGAIATAEKEGHAYLLIDRGGTLFQSTSLEQWGYHAGTSYWPALGPALSMYMVGIEIVAAGRVTMHKKVGEEERFQAWYHTKPEQYFKPDEVRYFKDNKHALPGYYHKFTDAQEKTLIATLLWLKQNAPPIFEPELIVGHHEISPGRKEDPGGAISIGMSDLRALIKRGA